MIEKDRVKFANMLADIGQFFGQSLNEIMVEIYWNALLEFDLATVIKGIGRHCVNPSAGKFFPRPADIISAITGDLQTLALMAWTKAINAVGRVGHYRSVAFDDPLIHLVIEDMGGWQRLCTTRNDSLPFVGKEFQDRYRVYATRRPTSHPKYLIGAIESQNSNNANNPLVLIGDETVAKQVVASGNDQPTLLIHNYSQSLKRLEQTEKNDNSVANSIW